MLTVVLLAVLFSAIDSKLYQVVSMTRHGARYHVNDFGDGNDTAALWGQLTAVGMRQHQRLGQLLRHQYIESLSFLSPVYNSSEIEVYSTPLNRTQQSIYAQLYGIYPPKTGPRLAQTDLSLHRPPYQTNKTDIDEMNYALPNGHQPIKVKTNLRIMISGCPNDQKYTQANFQRAKLQVQQMTATYYPFFKRLAPMFNYSAENATFYTMLRAWDVVNVDKYLGRPLPDGFTAQDEANLFHLANWWFYVYAMDKNSVLYSSGKIEKVLQMFDLRVRLPDSYPIKWTFLSGHDTDIVALHWALNLSSYQCIEEVYRKGKTDALNCQNGANNFASNLIFQLHSDDNGKTFYVMVRSNGKYVNLCNKAALKCEYLEFKLTYKKSIASNIDQLCGKKVTYQGHWQTQQKREILQL